MSLERQYNSAAGTDITAVIGNKVVGELQAISYSTTREKGPIYTLGSPDPRSFARGKRAVAGTLVFATFDHTAILEYFDQEKVWVNKYDIEYAWTKGQGLTYETGDPGFNSSQAYVDQGIVGTSQANNAEDIKKEANAWYPDQIPPFDVYIVAANEYGAIAKKAILGVEILNEGGGTSVDDLMLAEQYTYIARGITPWTKLTTRQAPRFVNPTGGAQG